MKAAASCRTPKSALRALRGDERGVRAHRCGGLFYLEVFAELRGVFGAVIAEASCCRAHVGAGICFGQGCLEANIAIIICSDSDLAQKGLTFSKSSVYWVVEKLNDKGSIRHAV